MKSKIFSGILVALLLGLFIQNNVCAQINRPFSTCYQSAFSGCSQCSDSTVDSKIFQYEGCDVTVVYKIMTCNCPEPTTFVDIEYIRLNRNNPVCDSLLCALYPPPPGSPCVYNTSRLNINLYKQLSRKMYDDLIFSLFQEVRNNYMCPNYLTFKVFWPASCDAVCQITLVENGSLILQTKPCNLDICCGIEYKYCYNGHNNWTSIITQISGEIICYMPYVPTCGYGPGDEIILPDGTYHVLDASISECTSFCDNPK